MTGTFADSHRRAVVSGVAALAAGLLLAGCTASGTTGNRTTTVPAGALRLVAFDSCDDLLAGLRAAAKNTVTEYGLLGTDNLEYAVPALGQPRAAIPAPAPADAGNAAGAAAVPDGTTGGPAHSDTNTAVPGVDEPDLVKTDGKRIVVVTGAQLRVVDPHSRTVTGTLALGEGAYATNLLLAGDHALLLMASGGIDDIAGPRLVLVDVSGAPRILSSYAMDGSLVDARQVGSTVRVVVRSRPRLNFPQLENATPQQRLDANRAAIDRALASDWLPRYAVSTGGKTTRGSVPCDAVSRPADYSGSAMLTVLTMNLGADVLGTGDPVTIVADGNMVYSNGPSLYVVNDNRWRAQPMILPVRPNGGVAGPVVPTPPSPRTELYQFDTGGTGRPKYLGAGSVPGYVLNQYALSDWNDNLRVATTSGDSSTVYVLHRSGGTLRQVGSVGGLGKGQRIYAVRFDAGVGYVVTFRQTDPLYTLDLRDPAHPKVTGSLEINGYSAYLHPLGNGRLIGVGQEADANGRVQGTQVSLFDVSDPAAPKRLAQFHVQYGHSEAEFDRHAFLYWPATNLLVIPMTSMALAQSGAVGGGNAGSGGAAVGKVAPGMPLPIAPAQVAGAVALHVSNDSITQLATVSHQNEAISRSLVVDRTLWTVGPAGLGAYDIGTLATQSWVGF